MLFHVTARHSVDNCGLYSEEIRDKLQDFLVSSPERCKELGIKVHFAVVGHPDHVFYFLVEADDLTSVCVLLCDMPMKQEFDVKPVRQVPFER